MSWRLLVLNSRSQRHNVCVRATTCHVPTEHVHTSLAGWHCVCKVGHRALKTSNGSIICEPCPTHKPAVTEDGSGCIQCPGSVNSEGKCDCPTGIIVERHTNGTLLDKARCEVCIGNATAFSVINRCENCVCKPPNVYAGGMCLPPSTLFSTVNPNVNYSQLKFTLQSAWFVSNLYATSAACLDLSNLTACQALGNMCVMNMHSLSHVRDACGLFNTIYKTKAPFSSTHDISYWRSTLPWLYYGDEPGLAHQVLLTDPVPSGFAFAGINKTTDIKMIAAVYNVRGEFLRWEKVGGMNLQLCPGTTIKQSAAFSFGTTYKVTCDLSVEQLLRTHSETLFYDVYMDLDDEGERRKLLPVPTLVHNQQYNGSFINQGNMKDWFLSRRMFLVDTLSGREKSISAHPKVIRVASSVKIRFQLVPGTKTGQVFPPLLMVAYRDLFITKVETQTVSVTFEVEYEMDHSKFHEQTDTALSVMSALAVLWSLLKTVSWNRRVSVPHIDLMTFLKFLLFFAGNQANVLFTVTVGTGFSWLVMYKSQHYVSVLLPLPVQEDYFVRCIGWAFTLKCIQFLHKLSMQLSVDVFFIDWERPRRRAGRMVKANGVVKQDPSPVSIWRTYSVANEWSKIQTIRKINPSFQIMAVLFFLEVLGFSNLALRDPWSTLHRSPQAYRPSYSVTLRYGLATTLWLTIGFLQAIFFVFFYEPFVEDKIHRFVDSCSDKNISVLLLSHRCFGYYIHGRSVHGHAETNMEELTYNLMREAESLCPQKGLLPKTKIQTFQVSMCNSLRVQYDRIQQLFIRKLSHLIDSTSSSQYEQNIWAYHTMNQFLGSILDHAHPEFDYVVMDKRAFEWILGIEFLQPNDMKSIFYNDEAHSFSEVMFYGNEATLLIFDTLFFCVVDLGSQNFLLAALLTLAQQRIFHSIRVSVGRKNLVNKTLLHERFLR